MKTITLTPSALRQWTKLPAATRARLLAKVQGYAETGMGDVKKLSARSGARLRVGDYRVIFIEDAAAITIVAVGHRREICD